MYNPQLEIFICVADAGSFNKATEKLHITPPAILRQINLLEEKLDVTLFKRTHSGLILTEAGRSLYNDTKYIVQYCRESVVRAKNAAQKDTHIIRIGTSPMTPAQILLKLWPKIHESCPDTKFQLVPFDNTPENAREILKNLGKNIDLVAGLFDDTLLNFRECAGLELIQEPFCCAVSVNHKLANRRELHIKDLYGENLMLLRRGRSHYIDKLRDDLGTNHPKIHIIDFDFYNVSVFNQCEISNNILIAIGSWEGVHPLLKIIPVKWEHSVPYGLLYSPTPSEIVTKVLMVAQAAFQEKEQL